MDEKKTLAALCILASVTSVVFGIWGRDGTMIALSSFAVLFSAICFVYCSTAVYRFSAIMSITVLVCTIFIVSVASYGTMVDGGAISESKWVYICAVIQGVAIIPLIVMFYFTSAAVFKASYNWVIVSGLGWLVGMGMALPKCILIFAVQRAEINQGIMTNNNLVIMMMMNLIMFIVFSLILRSVFKKNRYIITKNGLEVRR